MVQKKATSYIQWGRVTHFLSIGYLTGGKGKEENFLDQDIVGTLFCKREDWSYLLLSFISHTSSSLLVHNLEMTEARQLAKTSACKPTGDAAK